MGTEIGVNIAHVIENSGDIPDVHYFSKTQ
jgi:hypothetical protein